MKQDATEVFFEALPSGGVSTAITNQEARGQRQFVGSDTLPKKLTGCTRADVEALGIVYGKDVDDLFVSVTLPDGWKKVATDHSMWSELIDNNGTKRASIFYKAAFYDRDAFVSLERE